MTMSPKMILDKLGGYREVATALRIKPNTVHNWTRRRIPAEQWVPILDMAQRRGIALTFYQVSEARGDMEAK